MSQFPSRRNQSPSIAELAVIGDQRTVALLTREAAIVWYCPRRFDQPALFAALLDPAAGACYVDVEDFASSEHRYLDQTAVLETCLHTTNGGRWLILDWISMGAGELFGLVCRRFGPAPANGRVLLVPRPNYGQHPVHLVAHGERHVSINDAYQVYASRSIAIVGDSLEVAFNGGDSGWVALSETLLSSSLEEQDVEHSLAATTRSWGHLARETPYAGPYERELQDSLRALRLLYHAESGGFIAAPTTSLPEVAGGSRNYDYRYVWLRDSAMIVSALVRAGNNGDEERRFLEFICASARDFADTPLRALMTLDYGDAPPTVDLDLAGYQGSRPVRIGNSANYQLQLDGYGNVLLAAALIYKRHQTREHWSVIARVAEFLAERWREPDNGIWEEQERRHYTCGKVLAACGLDSIAAFTDDPTQAERWRAAVQAIRQFVARECLTAEGAYAAYAGSQSVDVSAALFPVWAYTSADAPEMIATIAVLQRDYSDGGLFFRRHLVEFDSREEGAFLAGTLWVAQYWVMRDDLVKARQIVDAVLGLAGPANLLAEEASVHTREMLGNFPQSFVHAALVGTIIDLRDALALQRGKGET